MAVLVMGCADGILEKHKAIIDYSRSALYLKTNPDGKD